MTKKFLSILLVIIMVLTIAPVSVFAQDDVLSYLTYEIADGEVTITGCNESISGDVVIPDTIEGYPVTAIASCSGYCANLTSVTIPSSVIEISNYAFEDCVNLTSILVDKNNEYYSNDESGVLFDKYKIELIKYPTGNNRTIYTIPDGVIKIGYEAFSGSRLERISIPNSVMEIGNCSFENCENLSDVTIPDSVSVIDFGAFRNCTSLTKITIPDSVMELDSNVFEHCEKLTIVTLPDSLAEISDDLFSHCYNLANIEIPESVTSIGDGAFWGCDLSSVMITENITSIGDDVFSNLLSITVDENNNVYSSDEYGVLFNKDKTKLIHYPRGNSRTKYSIPNGVTTIADSAFEDCSNLVNLTIPEGITVIPDYAFIGCKGLESIVIPDSVVSIGDYAFTDCRSLTSIAIPNNVTTIGSWSFKDCKNLSYVTIPDSVKTIGYYAFGYFYTVESGFTIVDGFTISSISGSAAETYANEHGITFVDINMSELIVNNNNSSITVTDTVVNSAPEMSVSAFIENIENEKVLVLSTDGKELAKDALVGTGSKLQVLDNDGKVLSEYEVMVKSDVDGNGKITPADARLALRASAKLDKLEGVFETAANYDDKDAVSTSDARMILRKAAGLE